MNSFIEVVVAIIQFQINPHITNWKEIYFDIVSEKINKLSQILYIFYKILGDELDFSKLGHFNCSLSVSLCLCVFVGLECVYVIVCSCLFVFEY